MKILDEREVEKRETEENKIRDILDSGWKTEFGKFLEKSYNEMIEDISDISTIVGKTFEEKGQKLEIREKVIKYLKGWWKLIH